MRAPATPDPRLVGLAPEDAAAMGPELAAKVRVFRLLHHLGQQVRFLADTLYREDGITAQQAMLLGIVDMLKRPSLSEVAAALATSHQNVKQIARALERKGFLTMSPDRKDARVRRLATTPKNKRYWASRDGRDFEVVATWFPGLAQDQLDQLLALLLELHGGVRAAVRNARTPPKRATRTRARRS